MICELISTSFDMVRYYLVSLILLLLVVWVVLLKVGYFGLLGVKDEEDKHEVAGEEESGVNHLEIWSDIQFVLEH